MKLNYKPSVAHHRANIEMTQEFDKTPLQSSPQSPLRAPKYIALIPAAGVGTRMGGDLPKQYLSLAGKSVLQHTVDSFLANASIDHIYVVVSEFDAYADAAMALPDDSSTLIEKLHILRCGGASRQETVRNGLRCIAQMQDLADSDWVLVHDAARPGLSSELIDKLIQEIGQDQNGGLLAMPVVDTVKRCQNGRTETISRDGLWLAQTPQMFPYGQLCDALDAASKRGIAMTDEASAMEAIGHHPRLIVGSSDNRKLTMPDDLEFLQMVIQRETKKNKEKTESLKNEK